MTLKTISLKKMSLAKTVQNLAFKPPSYKSSLVSFLESLAHSLRSGTSLKGAVEEAVTVIIKVNSEINSELKADLSEINHQLSLGTPLEEALRHWGANNPSPEIAKSVAMLIFGLNTNFGGNRARGIEALAANFQVEIAMEEEIHSLSTQARVSAIVIASLPAFFLFFFGALDVSYLSFLFTTGIGAICLVLGTSLDIVGAFWMKKILANKYRVKKGLSYKQAIWLAVGVGFVGLFLFSFILGILIGSLFWFWFGVLGKKRIPKLAQKQYELELSRELSDLVDFFIIALSSGLTIRLALESIMESVDDKILPHSKKIFAQVLDATQLGTPLADALSSTPRSLSPLIVPLVESERYGIELLPTLDKVASHIKEANRRRAETEARKIPVKLLFPLVVCVLPAFGLFTLMPIFIRSIQSIIQ